MGFMCFNRVLECAFLRIFFCKFEPKMSPKFRVQYNNENVFYHLIGTNVFNHCANTKETVGADIEEN